MRPRAHYVLRASRVCRSFAHRNVIVLAFRGRSDRRFTIADPSGDGDGETCHWQDQKSGDKSGDDIALAQCEQPVRRLR
jgi:hypothetical protein